MDNVVLERLDFESALQAELKEPSSLLPSRVVEKAFSSSPQAVAGVLAGEVELRNWAKPPEVVVAAKSSRGFRPVHVLALEQRVVYRALAEVIAQTAGYPDRSNEAYDSFTSSPLQHTEAEFVVRADVASFYQYVDHDLLVAEVVSQTGESEVASSISAFVEAVMGRRFGLPQNNGSSHLLADLHIDIVERRMIRLGHNVARYSDDFAMAAEGIGEARKALEDLESGLRSVGLTPNDEKSMVHTRDRYQRWINRPKEVREGLDIDLDIDLDAWILLPPTGYEEELEDDEAEEDESSEIEDEAQVKGAVRTLDKWRRLVVHNGDGPIDPLERYVHRRLARDSLRLLRRRASSAGVKFCRDLMAFEPQMSPTVCRYLHRVAGQSADPMFLVGEIAGQASRYLSDWQCLWLLEPLLVSAHQLTKELNEWVLDLQTHASSSYLRARATLVLANSELIGPETVALQFETATDASKPDLVAAMTLVSEGRNKQLESVVGESQLLRLLAESYSDADS